MNSEQSQTKSQSNESGSLNLWKWAFITLATGMIFLVLYLAYLLRPVEIDSSNNFEDSKPPYSDAEVIQLTSTIPSDDVEWLMNTYLDQSLGEDFANYQIELSDKLELHGAVSFLSFDIPFSLFFSPYVLKNGNIQLRGEAVEVGQFSLPIQTVMRLFSNQMDLPDFITINSEAEYINIYLDRLFNDQDFNLSMKKIDLVADDIQIDLYLAEEAIMENINNLEITN